LEDLLKKFEPAQKFDANEDAYRVVIERKASRIRLRKKQKVSVPESEGKAKAAKAEAAKDKSNSDEEHEKWWRDMLEESAESDNGADDDYGEGHPRDLFGQMGGMRVGLPDDESGTGSSGDEGSAHSDGFKGDRVDLAAMAKLYARTQTDEAEEPPQKKKRAAKHHYDYEEVEKFLAGRQGDQIRVASIEHHQQQQKQLDNHLVHPFAPV
jgi:hypothetical protein